MFTETELRDALLRSADRVGTPDGPIALSPAPRTVVEMDPRRTSRRRSVALPVVAASLVLALAAGAVVLQRHDGPPLASGSGASPSASTSPPSSVTVRPDTHVRPSHHTPADVGEVVDAVQLSGGPTFEYDLARSGAEVVTRDLDARTFAQVTVIRPKAGFDADRIPRDHPVRIAGTTGYYGLVRIDPLDGSASDKYSPAWVVAFPSSGGTWIVAELDHAPGPNATFESVPNPSRIVAAYAGLQLKYTNGTARVPFRVSYLPVGLTVDGLTVNPLANGTQVTADVTKGSQGIEIDSYPAGLKQTQGIRCIPSPGPCPATALRTVGGITIKVTGNGFGDAVVRRVLDSLVVARSATDESGWYGVADSLG